MAGAQVSRCTSSGQESERDSLQRQHASDDGAGFSEGSAVLIEGNVNCTSNPNLTWSIAQDTYARFTVCPILRNIFTLT